MPAPEPVAPELDEPVLPEVPELLEAPVPAPIGLPGTVGTVELDGVLELELPLGDVALEPELEPMPDEEPEVEPALLGEVAELPEVPELLGEVAELLEPEPMPDEDDEPDFVPDVPHAASTSAHARGMANLIIRFS